jgi:hypothetical protein
VPALVVVVMDCQGNGFLQLLGRFECGERWQFILERTKEPFHEAVLPGAGFVGRAKLYLQPLAQFLVFVAQIFTALVGAPCLVSYKYDRENSAPIISVIYSRRFGSLA